MSLFKRNSIRTFSLSPSLLLAIGLLFPLRLLGADQPVPQTEQPASQPAQTVPQTAQPASQPKQTQPAPKPKPPVPPVELPDGFESLDAPRNYMSEKVISFANYMDRFFGGNRHYQESNQSVIRLDLTRIVGYGDNHKFDLAGNVSLRLPGTEGRLRLWLQTDPENEINDDPTRDTHTLQNKAAPRRSSGLAARYTTPGEEAWRFTADAGLKFPLINLDPFTRLKAEYSTPVGDWHLKAAESVYWFRTLGVGETTQLDLEKLLSSSRLFRSSSNATWLKDKENVDLVQSFSVYETLNSRSVVIYQASGSWITNPSFMATDFVLLALYRYRVHQKWLYLELSPQLHFPHEKDYKGSPAFSVRLEALFDESK